MEYGTTSQSNHFPVDISSGYLSTSSVPYDRSPTGAWGAREVYQEGIPAAGRPIQKGDEPYLWSGIRALGTVNELPVSRALLQDELAGTVAPQSLIPYSWTAQQYYTSCGSGPYNEWVVSSAAAAGWHMQPVNCPHDNISGGTVYVDADAIGSYSCSLAGVPATGYNTQYWTEHMDLDCQTQYSGNAVMLENTICRLLPQPLHQHMYAAFGAQSWYPKSQQLLQAEDDPDHDYSYVARHKRLLSSSSPGPTFAKKKRMNAADAGASPLPEATSQLPEPNTTPIVTIQQILQYARKYHEGLASKWEKSGAGEQLIAGIVRISNALETLLNRWNYSTRPMEPKERVGGYQAIHRLAAVGAVELFWAYLIAVMDDSILCATGGPRELTPLHVAIACSNLSVVEFLLAYKKSVIGINVPAKYDSSDKEATMTPLHAAYMALARAGRNKGTANRIVDALLSAGADRNARDKDGHTPIEKHGHTMLIDLFAYNVEILYISEWTRQNDRAEAQTGANGQDSHRGEVPNAENAKEVRYISAQAN